MKLRLSILSQFKYASLFLFFFTSFSFPSIAQEISTDSLKIEISKYLSDLSFQEGIQYLKSKIPQYKQQPLAQAEFYHQLALKYHNNGIFDSCLVYLPNAIKLRRENNAQALHFGRSLMLMGANYLELFSYERAIPFSSEAADVFRDASIFMREAYAYEDLARIFKFQGNYGAALFSIQKVKEIYTQEGALNFLSDAICIEGAIQDDLNQNDAAEKTYLNGIQFINQEIEINDPVLEAFKGGIYNNYALLLTKLKKWKKAEDYFLKAINAFKLRASLLSDEKAYLEGQIINVYANLAKVYNEQELLDKSLDISNKGLQMADTVFQSKKQMIIAELYMHQGTAFAKQEKETESLDAFEKSINSLIIHPTNFSSFAQKDLVIVNELVFLEVLHKKAQALVLLGQKKRAFQSFQQADKLVDRIRLNYPAKEDRLNLIRRTRQIYEHTLSLLKDMCQQDNQYCKEAYHFISKYKAIFLLEDINSSQIETYFSIPDDDLTKERQLRLNIVQLQTEMNGNADLVKLSEAKNQYFNFLQSIKEKHPAYYELTFKINQALELKEIQGILPKNSLLVEFFIGKDNLYVVGISNSSYSFDEIPLLENFQEICYKFRALIEDQKIDNTFIDTAYELYSLLLEKTLAKHNGIKRLFIIPEKELNLFAFEALITKDQENWQGKNNAYLIYDYAVSYLFSNQFLISQQKKKTASLPYLGFGIEYDDFTLGQIQNYSKQKMSKAWKAHKFGRLFFSDDEVREAQQIWSGNIWLNEQASKDTFLLYAKDSKILHLAMHGLLNEQQPLQSSLIFSRQDSTDSHFLKAGDLYSMSLSADLAVLSACQTAFEGTQDSAHGLRSLSRAFTYAGCESLVASLWNATDKSSKEIILSFFHALKEDQPKDIALQGAKLEYIENSPPAFSHPFYWAPLIHTGQIKPIGGSNPPYLWYIIGAVLLLGIGYIFILNNKKRRLT